MKTVTLTDLANGVAKVFDQVRVGHEPISISRHGHEIAVISPIQNGLSGAELADLYEKNRLSKEDQRAISENFEEYEAACRRKFK